MNKTRYVLALAAIAALGVTLSHGYALIGKKWFSAPAFYINTSTFPSGLSQTDGVTAIKAGLTGWGTGTYAGTTSRVHANDGYNVVAFKKLSGLTLAQTYVGYYSSSQTQICNGVKLYAYLDTDMDVNSKTAWTTSTSGCSGKYDLQGVVLHEAGHALGLGHSSVSAATMYPSVSACNFNIRTLESDDKNGYSAIYSCK